MAETYKETTDRIKSSTITTDPDDDGPGNFDDMMRQRKATLFFLHVVSDAETRAIFRAEADCEIEAAHFFAETGFSAGAASPDLLLVDDSGDGVSQNTIATLDGTVDGVTGGENNEWSNATTGLPGVYAPGPLYVLEAGHWLVLTTTVNGGGSALDNVTVDITYRLK